VTPPVGSPLFTGVARSIVDPLQARGIVLTGIGEPIVILSIDWCEIRNNSYDLWRTELAKAAHTRRERILLSCVHPHDAPYTDSYAQQLLTTAGVGEKLCDPEFEKTIIAKVAAAVRNASPQPVTHLGTGQAKVSEVASNRRYVLPDGKVSFGRTSATRDPALRAHPEGLIDPYLKAVSFWNGNKAIAALHAYSTHPMSYYGQCDVTCDFPGLARNRLQAEFPHQFQVYCSAASGDTMAGKYNDGNHANRATLTGRMHQAMKQALDATTVTPISSSVSFRNTEMILKPRDTDGYRIEQMQSILENAKESHRRRFDAALGLSWRARLKEKRPIDVPALHIGPASLLLLPAEMFVGYQLWAQQRFPKRFVFTLGFGECAPGYIPTQSNVAEGYNDHYSWIDFATTEAAIHAAITRVMA
jgi:hypothetical protein